MSPIKIKPATVYRNEPANEFYVRCFEGRGIFLSNEPDSKDLQRACLEEKCRLTPIMVVDDKWKKKGSRRSWACVPS
jgi:hypothetical protein